jgi:tRNA dimethylallyltransferase
MDPAPVHCLVGPTGSGKSEVGVLAARSTRGEIVCCDAYTVYRAMPILTAAPSPPSDVPHHLLGIVGADETYDAARFLTDCDHEIAGIRERGRTPWIVGGAALYLRCWLKGFGAEVPTDADYRRRLKERVKQEGPGVLHEELARKDPARAAELHPHDLRRVGRALEIIRATGRPASEQRLEWDGPDRVAARVVGLRRDLADLDRRIDERTGAMFQAGLVDEARALFDQELSPQAGQALGLSELRALLAGEIDENEARAAITRRTRRFARKQMTFFNSFAALTWIDVPADESPEDTAARVQ